MTNPLETTNPQDFKLRIYWIVGLKDERIVAEFDDCKWLPRIGETLVLPIKEAGKSWHKFKVVDIVYDFQRQTVRVWCKPKDVAPGKTAFSDSEKQILQVEARRGAIEAAQRLEKIEQSARQHYQLVPKIEVDVDEELDKLKAEILERIEKD